MSEDEQYFRVAWSAQMLLDLLGVVAPSYSGRRPKHVDAVYWHGTTFDRDRYFACVHRPHRLFNLGDLVVTDFTNGGGERWSFVGYSTKKRAFVGPHYFSYAKYVRPSGSRYRTAQDATRGVVRLLHEEQGVPDRGDLADPVFRASLHETLTLASITAIRVGRSSPELLEGP